MPDAHAILSPSSADRWSVCPGSVVLTLDAPDDSSEYADWGTAAHTVAERCLTTEHDAAFYRGERIDVGPHKTVECDAPMVECVQFYIDYVRQAAQDAELHVEQRVDVGHVVEGCWGTSDAVIIREDEIHIIDLKGGMGVKVSAQTDGVLNKQMGLYALGALEKFGMAYDFKRVRVTIVQPRLNWVSEYDMPVSDLLAFGEQMRKAAERPIFLLKAYELEHDTKGCMLESDLVPGEKQCKFCKAKPCGALDRQVAEATGADFEDLTQTALPAIEHEAVSLAAKMAKVELVEQWCKAVRGAVEAELLQGHEVEGWKLVQGRAGARAWANADEAEEQLKAMRLKAEQMYDFKLISPTTAEKMAKAETIGPRQWKKLEALITRSGGSKSVAPASDPRPALVVEKADAGFEDVSTGEDLC